MHIFCKYGPWVDIAALTSGGLLIQEKRCSDCNKVKRRQTSYLAGDFDKPIPSVGHRSTVSSRSNPSQKEAFLAGYTSAMIHGNSGGNDIDDYKEVRWEEYLRSVSKPQSQST